jgi:DNA-binding transcriptional regulator GbsR (MarR family)
MAKASREQLLDWVERVAGFMAEQYGLPPITGRILGWLMICDPPEQSAGDIASAIGASRASLTTNMRLLVDSTLVRRLTRPGARTTYYRVDDDAWETVVRRRMASMAAFREITQAGMKLVGTGSQRAARLHSADATYAWVQDMLMRPPTRKRRTP